MAYCNRCGVDYLTEQGHACPVWVCPWGICNTKQAQQCRAEMRRTKCSRGCGTYFPAGTTLEQAKRMIAPPLRRADGWFSTDGGLSWRNPAPNAAAALVPTSTTKTVLIGS